MSQTYGIESAKHQSTAKHQSVRYVIVIDTGGVAIARLFLENRQQVDEFDASVPEVVQMISGVASARGALGTEWDAALRGHSASERKEAEVYTLEV